MINKKGQAQNDNAAAGYLVLFVIGIFLLYLLSQFLFWLGIGLFIGGIILLIYAFNEQEDNLILVGIILLIVGIAAFFIGVAGINFFENNEVGSELLNTSKDLINTGVETYNSVQDAKSTAESATLGALEQVEESLT